MLLTNLCLCLDYFLVLSQNCEKLLIVSLCLVILQTVRMEQLGSRLSMDGFHEICYLNIL